ncbi:putative translation initiation inhibitor, yjgF family [Herbaspirillum sp. CF444]|uniref:RidA family protein n=1 Tax=Herbaspirillum sp. CF444 TaxID=1144319 RepID=UPI0002723A10|nr:RidA family protein [Herbaspirillum sp. CF444]EJL88250.1 putative translation initiation inhibitor, yjgF family [Herbaspirillum sp. CF444]
MSPEQRLHQLGWALPIMQPANGTYMHYRIEGSVLYLAGHGPRIDEKAYLTGRIECDEDIERGYAGARLTGLNILATAKEALGELSRIDAVIRVFGMVNASAEFTRHFNVIDGCSDLFVEVLGNKGRHVRTAVGMSSLPHGMSVEIEVFFKIRPA